MSKSGPAGGDEIRGMLVRGQYIPAVKRVRELTGMDLKQAKLHVDLIAGEMAAAEVPAQIEAEARSLIARGKRRDAARAVRRSTPLDRTKVGAYLEFLVYGPVGGPQDTPAPQDAPPGAPQDAPPGAPQDAPPGAPQDAAPGVPQDTPPPSAPLSDRVRAFRASGDHASAVALVQAETGMTRDEAERFIAALR